LRMCSALLRLCYKSLFVLSVQIWRDIWIVLRETREKQSIALFEVNIG